MKVECKKFQTPFYTHGVRESLMKHSDFGKKAKKKNLLFVNLQM